MTTDQDSGCAMVVHLPDKFQGMRKCFLSALTLSVFIPRMEEERSAKLANPHMMIWPRSVCSRRKKLEGTKPEYPHRGMFQESLCDVASHA